MSQFSHLDDQGKPTMVDVGEKTITERSATALSKIKLPDIILSQFKAGDIQTKKGAVFQTAVLAGIMGAKQTAQLIPLCHPLPLTKCDVNIHLNEENEVEVWCMVKTKGQTGVEMEALTGASIASLTIYDMCKAFSHDIIIAETKLMAKSGGKRDFSRTE